MDRFFWVVTEFSEGQSWKQQRTKGLLNILLVI